MCRVDHKTQAPELGSKIVQCKVENQKSREEHFSGTSPKTAKWSPVLHDFYNFQLRIR